MEQIVAEKERAIKLVEELTLLANTRLQLEGVNSKDGDTVRMYMDLKTGRLVLSVPKGLLQQALTNQILKAQRRIEGLRR